MAKKVVASFKGASAKDITKVIKMVKSPKTGAYAFKEAMIPNNKIKEYIAAKEN
ncbi:MAG: DUF4295 domain-containing protein [Bacteroidales bacterium]|nr:DUF4295 domain-containing protein [Bacteroidota bacterium]MBL6949658.1 DUF4295 domain-containing protein [Bacteroidales bacterium]